MTRPIQEQLFFFLHAQGFRFATIGDQDKELRLLIFTQGEDTIQPQGEARVIDGVLAVISHPDSPLFQAVSHYGQMRTGEPQPFTSGDLEGLQWGLKPKGEKHDQDQ